MKNYTLPVIGFGLLALIYGLYYASARPLSEPIIQAEANLPTTTQTRPLIQSTVVEPDRVAHSPVQAVVNVPVIQAAAPVVNVDQTKTSLSVYDKLCNRPADENKLFRSDICTWRQQLRSEPREEPWASEAEAAINDCLEALLANNPNLARSQRIECRRSGCEVQSLATGETRNFVFGSPATMCNSDTFRQLLTAAGKGCTTNDGQSECVNFFRRRDYTSDTEADSSPLPTVHNPVRIAEGFEKILQPQAADVTFQSTEIARLHMLLESELRDETWAPRIEQEIRRYVDTFLAQQGVEPDALILHVAACGQTMCEVQVSISREVVRDSALNWQAINRQMIKEAFTNEFNGNGTLVTTLSNGKAGFVSFYQRRK